MALQVWLPLTKDLRNQGLSNTTVSIMRGNETWDNNGKLGKCFYANGVNTLQINNIIPQLYNANGYSLCAWFYIESQNTVHSGAGIVSGGNWNSQVLNLSVSDWSSDHYTRLRVSGTNWNNTYSYNFYKNTWYHAVVCSDGNKTYAYVNGQLIGDTVAGFLPSSIKGNNIAIGGATYYSGMQFFGKINDVRIYDHCLSPMEIKKLSQGLACHYNLSDGTAESTTNIITTEDCLTSTCYNGATSKYGYGATTDMYKTVTTFDGKKGTKVYMGTNGNPAFPYVYIGNMYTSNGGSYPLDRTLSFDYYSTISTSIRPYKLGSGSGTATYRVQNASTGISTGTGTDAVMIPVKPNMWNHIEITFHSTTTDSAQWGYIQNYPSHTSDTSNFWFFANMQLENKDHATAYAGVGGTRTSAVIYDTSGYCNNGTITGDLTTSIDTPKYQASIHMPTAATISHPRCLDNTSQEWTCAAWVKPDAAGNYQNLNNFNESNRLYHGTYPLLYLNSGINDYYNYGNLALPANQWSHIVFVFKNSTGTKLIYVNGENRTNTGGPNKTSTPKGIPDTVIIGGSFAGYMCDYREYATALSASDIKSLYQNCATIDPDGTIRGQIRS